MEETCLVPSIVWPLWLLAAIPMTVVEDWLTQRMVRVYRHGGEWRAAYASMLPRSAVRYLVLSRLGAA